MHMTRGCCAYKHLCCGRTQTAIYCQQLPRDRDGAQSCLGAKTSPYQKQKARVHMAFITRERQGRAPMQGIRAGMPPWRVTAPYLRKDENGTSSCKMSCYVFLSHGIFREAVGGVAAAITIKFSWVFFSYKSCPEGKKLSSLYLKVLMCCVLVSLNLDCLLPFDRYVSGCLILIVNCVTFSSVFYLRDCVITEWLFMESRVWITGDEYLLCWVHQ